MKQQPEKNMDTFIFFYITLIDLGEMARVYFLLSLKRCYSGLFAGEEDLH